ncbi:hypothetical protein BUMB_02059 [Candidatus Paraburkholderia calva]|nr:hypothetical protein BUMB_02059 [Candidatus Paraburkholderia calva]
MSLIKETAAGLDGLAQLRKLIASGRKPGILMSLEFDFIEVESGRAVFADVSGDHTYNPIGAVHGGYVATLLDSACGCSAHSCLTATHAYTTLELKVAYHKAITRDMGLLRAEGRLLSIGWLFASATSTLLVMER